MMLALFTALSTIKHRCVGDIGKLKELSGNCRGIVLLCAYTESAKEGADYSSGESLI